MTFKMSCHAIRAHQQISTHPQQTLFGVGGLSHKLGYVKMYFKLPQLIETKRVLRGGGVVMGRTVYISIRVIKGCA